MADVAKKVQDYKDSLKAKAEHLIVKGFPEKIVQLNELLETSYFSNRDLADVHQDLNIPVPPPIVMKDEPNAKRPRLESSEVSTNSSSVEGTKVLALSSGSVPCNKPLSDLIALVKPHIRELVEDSNLLKMWISYMIPKIEDGNNFGVSIQEDTLAEVQSVESEAAAFFDQISRYFISRAKIVSKVAKYPHIDDYRRAVKGDSAHDTEQLSPRNSASDGKKYWTSHSKCPTHFFKMYGKSKFFHLMHYVSWGKLSDPVKGYFIKLLRPELDEKEYLSLWLVMCEIRNRYCSLHDIVIKNLEKIKKPRSSNAESLY